MCETIRMPDGGVAFVCRGHGRRRKCHVCGRAAGLLCDWPLAGGKTCDKPICRQHARAVGKDRDYCLNHQSKGDSAMADFPEFDSYDQGGLKPEKRTSFRPGIDALPDGPYDLLVLQGCELKRDKKENRPIFVVPLRVCGGPLDGKEVQRDYWLTSVEGTNILLSDLLMLGSDTQKWGRAHGRPIEDEIKKAAITLPGLKFYAAMKTSQSNGYTNHNLWINGVFAGRHTVPPAPAQPSANGQHVGAPEECEIPF